MVSVERQYQNDIDEARAERDAAIRALDAIRDELMAAGLDVAGDEPADKLAHHVFVLRMGLAEVSDQLDALRAKLNTPHTADFIEALRIEAAHQRERWGVQHDANKAVEDWAALFVRLLGKMVDAHWSGDVAKLLHHVITIAAVAANCHARLTERLDAIGRRAAAGASASPGIEMPKDTP